MRSARKAWEDASAYPSVEQFRIDTKACTGADFNLHNAELYRLLGIEFNQTSLEDVIKSIGHSHGVNAWYAILANTEGNNYRTELRRRAENIVANAYCDPNRNFSFEDYFQKHTRHHDMMSKAGEPVSDWQKIEKFMQGVRCQSLQTVYITSTMANRHMTFTQFCNDIHEKHRRLVDTKQIKPASVFNKWKINAISTEGRGDGRGRGHGRGRGRGRGRHGGRGGKGRGRGRGGRGNTGRDSINWHILPAGVTPNGNLDFDDDTWCSFSNDVREEIKKLRRLKHQQRNINSLMSSAGFQQRYPHGGDDCTITDRSVFNVNVPQLPPPPGHTAPTPPENSTPPMQSETSSTRSNAAGSAFSRRGS